MSAAPFTAWGVPETVGLAVASPGETFAGRILAHLDEQLASAQRMRRIVLEQASAIRRRAVRQVVSSAGELQVEMHRRELIERERGALVLDAAGRLGIAPDAVGFSHLCGMLDAEASERATGLVRELRELLTQIEREHELNRQLMSQELAFLDHLLSLAGGSGSYAAATAVPTGTGGAPSRRIRRNTAVRRRVFDLEA